MVWGTYDMRLTIQESLSWVSATLCYNGNNLQFDKVLLDTGSASCIFAVDRVLGLGIEPELDDTLHTIRGVGGTEVVFTRRLQDLDVGDCQANDFEVEIGNMDYGFNVADIIDMDFLLRTQAIIDLKKHQISSG